ncbi:MAG: hypothetical protein IEMM0003_0766 [bacterium]|nr:MAG: hypothetical protein IEMM0003_0766 [bacterium]
MPVLRKYDLRNMAELIHISAILDDLSKTPQIKKVWDFKRIADSWKTIGSPMSSCSSPKRFENGILYIKCKDGIWAQELSMIKEKILAKLNGLQEIKIKEIRFYI